MRHGALISYSVSLPDVQEKLFGVILALVRIIGALVNHPERNLLHI